jgi:hypothetical protein
MAEHLVLVQSLQLVVVVAELTTHPHLEVQEIVQVRAVAEILEEVVAVVVVVALVHIPVVEGVAPVLLVLDHPEIKHQLALALPVKDILAAMAATLLEIVPETVVAD